MPIKALSGFVIVKRDPLPDEVLASGIVLPEYSREKSQWGTAVTADECNEVQLGDRVLMSRHVGQEITVRGESFLRIQESDILAVV